MPHRNRPHLVPEAAIGSPAALVFAEARRALGLHFVPELFRAYAAIPGFPEAMWPIVGPALGTYRFVHCSERLRAQAYTEVFNYLNNVPALLSSEPVIDATVDMFHCAAPRLLLFSTVLLRAMESPVGRAETDNLAAAVTCPEGVVPINEEEASAALRTMFNEYRNARGTNLVSCWFLALAHWPAFLHDYWSRLKPVAASPIYSRIELELRESAFAFPDHLPVEVDLTPERLAEAGMTPGQIAEAGRITSFFAAQYSSMVLEVELARLALERGAAQRLNAIQQVA